MPQLIFIIVSCLLPTTLLLIMDWFDGNVTPNPHLRLQANFEFVFGLMFSGLTLWGATAPASADPFLFFDSKVVTVVLFIYSANCLLLSFPAMLGACHSRSVALAPLGKTDPSRWHFLALAPSRSRRVAS